MLIPGRRGRGRIGLLGGSFNPAHSGHLGISLAALQVLKLDQIWWLVSPQNPLKSTDGMAGLDDRLAAARKIGADRRIVVTDIERRLGTRFTVDTIRRLRQGFPSCRFYWLMGADNMVQIPRWHRWTQIFELAPVAVFNRPEYAYRALAGPAAQRFSGQRVSPSVMADRPGLRLPCWCFVWKTQYAVSATAIRSKLGQGDVG